MISIDTNVLVRVLIDDPDQAEQVRIARNIASESSQVYVAQAVQIEMIWVLQAAYHIDKSGIIRALDHLLHNQSFVLQSEDHFLEALTNFKASNCDFSDCLILATSQASICTLLTFDKKLSRLPGVQLACYSES